MWLEALEKSIEEKQKEINEYENAQKDLQKTVAIPAKKIMDELTHLRSIKEYVELARKEMKETVNKGKKIARIPLPSDKKVMADLKSMIKLSGYKSSIVFEGSCFGKHIRCACNPKIILEIKMR